ncbi:putative transmembrane transcriptional regulator (anti-sigma factor) [Variovorax sp. PBL-H6]|uniref:anti-sigma factor family protein n=1 Tax=Variovorax sp. PBL-H6 TaxID=434009 RepID=UPI0013197AB8|nr:anti-sigma factor [Variovorax sp. PBL-H6]VTU29301.1 putative transmembrane transcriptional regulator (anti-sigma factor) [Variovorax sp. PBL-H6]
MKPPSSSAPDTDQPAWRTQRDALRRLHSEVLDESIPPSLLAAAEMVAARQDQHARWMRWSGIAAGLLVAFGAGWLGSAEWTTQRQALQAKAPPTREFVHAAAVAHALYAPEKRHPVEVAAAEQDHLVQWLSKRLNKPLKVPELSAQGYALVGGRLVPGSQGARAQFMFERGDGERLTLYIGSLDASAIQPTQQQPQPLPGETAFRYSAEGPVSSFYWVDQGFGYALTGNLPREVLLSLAGAVYRQL